MPECSVIDAVREALREEMRRDPTVFIMGEDVGQRGGVFLATQGFLEEFGRSRVIDTPLAEAAIMGIALGAAFRGLRPISEIQFSDFIWPSVNQLIGEAARVSYGTNGALRVPVVIRVPYGGGIRGGLFHSQNVEAYFFHTPGLKVVAPSTPYDAKGLLIASIREDDPVIFCEDRTILGARTHVPEEDYSIPLGVASIKREGNDVTIVAIGGMVPRALAAAEALAAEGISAEVLDPRTLVPLDKAAILKSVAKTGRLVVVDMAHKTCSAASEIAAIVAMEGFWDLQAPIQRLGTVNVHIPFSPALEPLCYPTDETIAAAVRVTLA